MPITTHEWSRTVSDEQCKELERWVVTQAIPWRSREWVIRGLGYKRGHLS